MVNKDLEVSSHIFLSVLVFKRFKKEAELPKSENQLIKVMKAYILAHFVILPAEIFIHFFLKDPELANSGLIYIALTLYLVKYLIQ